MQTATIHRFIITNLGLTKVTLPASADVIDAVPSTKGISVYFTKLDDSDVKGDRYFYGARTGQPLPALITDRKHATHLYTVRGGVHIYEVSPFLASEIKVLIPEINEADADLEIGADEH